MRNNFPKDCRECDKSNTCNNPGPYGSFQCAYRPQIMEAAIQEALLPRSEALTPCCGVKPEIHTERNPNLGITYICCPICGTLLLEDTRAKAIEGWNRGERSWKSD